MRNSWLDNHSVIIDCLRKDLFTSHYLRVSLCVLRHSDCSLIEKEQEWFFLKQECIPVDGTSAAVAVSPVTHSLATHSSLVTHAPPPRHAWPPYNTCPLPHTPPPPTVDRMTDACENITFPQQTGQFKHRLPCWNQVTEKGQHNFTALDPQRYPR